MAAPASVLNLPDDVRMLEAVRDGLSRADDVRIAVSFTKCSGLGLLIDSLREVGQRGGSVRFLTSTYQCVTQPEALDALRRLRDVQTRVQDGATGFHTKFWWFAGSAGSECWAGSSNLTKGGLDSNIEWNLRGLDRVIVESTRKQFDLLWDRDDVYEPDDAFMRRYRADYRARATVAEGIQAFQSIAADSSAIVTPNPPQTEALAELAALRSRDERRAAVIAAPGIGKTYLAAFDVLATKARTALYVSHRLEHLIQARNSFKRVIPEASMGLLGGGYNETDKDFIFATVASLSNRPDITNRTFDYLVIDEFHHAEAPSYEILHAVRDRAFLLGITATPERQDGRDVMAWCDWNIAYEVRIPEAIDRGWLLPFHYFGIADDTIDFLRIPWRRLGDDELGSMLSIEERADLVLRRALEKGFDGARRAAVGFCAGRKHAHFMASAFERRGQNAMAVLGDDPVDSRRAAYVRLADPQDPLEWIFVADVLNEGVDIPALNTVMFLRPTESATVFLQQLGRGLRLCPGTEVLTVLDFVGHHRSAWLTLKALDAPSAAGRRTEVANGIAIRPPRGCEVVLESRTQEILAKIDRLTRRDACKEAYTRLRAEKEQPLLPIDLWNRTDVPDLSSFRAAYGSWLNCQASNGDLPPWADHLPENHVVHALLRAVEHDWQGRAQRVAPYALTWGLCAEREFPERGYERFFERWPQWNSERSSLKESKTWDTVRNKLGRCLENDRLHSAIHQVLGEHLMAEVEGRMFYAINSDYQARHGGVLRSPSELNLFAKYSRPDVVRHFGVHYDPAKHNGGMLWFGNDGVVITKLDTSGAKTVHQYANRFLDDRAFYWTSQNRMGPDNESGKKVLEHEARGSRLHLFVQPRAKEQACYLGTGRVRGSEGANPMRVTIELRHAVPADLRSELEGQSKRAVTRPA